MKYIFSALIALLCSQNLISQTTVPYFNDFENGVAGWTHEAISGTDDWELGTPNDSRLSAAFSGDNAWVTNLNGDYSDDSEATLMTPSFNLSDTTESMVLSCVNKRYSGSSINFYIDYSIDGGASWQLLINPSGNSKSWQSTYGFSKSFYSSWNSIAIDLKFIQGNSDVKFRFRMKSGYANGEGWMIDDFSIDREYYNIKAVQGDTIFGLNRLFSEIPAEIPFTFDNQWTTSHYFKNKLHLSKDSILDPQDIYLTTLERTLSRTYTFREDIPMPSGLHAGKYYLIYELDQNDTLKENLENDNVNYLIMYLDSIQQAPYSTDFDTTAKTWNTTKTASLSNWKKGDPETWHIENARSGSNAWYTTDDISGGNINLESPYLDLTTLDSGVVCFWFRNSDAGYYSFKMKYANPANGVIDYPVFSSSSFSSYIYTIPRIRNYQWDCYCKPIGNKEVSTKILFEANGETHSISLNQTAIDDIYIGNRKPDAAIEGDKFYRFVQGTMDTLRYYYFNSGLTRLPSTSVKFYWSSDATLDQSDILLGEKTEPSLRDTAYLDTFFVYNVPQQSVGDYFIIYQIDEQNQIDEMRENDNIGFFKVHLSAKQNLPYFEDFENSTADWHHKASLGRDDWNLKTPTGYILDTAHSGTKAYVTSDTGKSSLMSRSHLFSPVFDLTTLSNPVLEFDYTCDMYGNGYNLWPFNMASVLYSTDGGFSWHTLDENEQSSKRVYRGVEFSSRSGTDRYVASIGGLHGSLGYGQKKHATLLNSTTYQGRDYDDVIHAVMDLAAVKNAKKIQFQFLYANIDAPVEGLLVDNFELTERRADLMVSGKNKIIANSKDKFIKHNFKLKNNENYTADSSTVKFFLSVDNTIDGADLLIQEDAIGELFPYQNRIINLKADAPVNYKDYQYLLMQCDAGNTVAESNEQNNVCAFNLHLDSAVTFPLTFDFSGELDGWNWSIDSGGIYHGHRFRNKTIVGEYAYNASSGEIFMDPVDQGGSTYISWYPTHYLELPPLNLTSNNNPVLNFDYISMGSNYSSDKQGGNLEYSIDGGDTWTVITTDHDPQAESWYNLSEVNSLNNEPGWGFVSREWQPAVVNLAFLNNPDYVRLRFKFRSNSRIYSPGIQGFRLRNMSVTEDIVTSKTEYKGDLIAWPNPVTDKFHIKGAALNPNDVEVRNLLGQRMAAQVSNLNSATTTVDFSQVKKGVYLVYIRSLGATFKVLKSN